MLKQGSSLKEQQTQRGYQRSMQCLYSFSTGLTDCLPHFGREYSEHVPNQIQNCWCRPEFGKTKELAEMLKISEAAPISIFF